MIAVHYFLYFLIYSFMGWLMEVGCKLVELKRFVNRGFLIGPLCTIYGYGVLGIVLLVGDPTQDILAVFLKSILICSVLEYLTSYFMEKIFKARWWDYSKKKFNLNGRVCLETMLPFGILGTIVVYFLHPTVVRLVDLVPVNMQILLSIIFFIFFIADNIASYTIMFKIKNEINIEKKDNTEYIREKVTDFLENKSFLYRRLRRAYPNFVIRLNEIKEEVEENVKKISDVTNKIGITKNEDTNNKN